MEDAFGESHPGSVHLRELSEEVKIGVYQSGGRPANLHGTDICDGWAMLHGGMNYIPAAREVTCGLFEAHGRVVPGDGAVAGLYVARLEFGYIRARKGDPYGFGTRFRSGRHRGPREALDVGDAVDVAGVLERLEAVYPGFSGVYHPAGGLFNQNTAIICRRKGCPAFSVVDPGTGIEEADVLTFW